MLAVAGVWRWWLQNNKSLLKQTLLVEHFSKIPWRKFIEVWKKITHTKPCPCSFGRIGWSDSFLCCANTSKSKKRIRSIKRYWQIHLTAKKKGLIQQETVESILLLDNRNGFNLNSPWSDIPNFGGRTALCHLRVQHQLSTTSDPQGSIFNLKCNMRPVSFMQQVSLFSL